MSRMMRTTEHTATNACLKAALQTQATAGARLQTPQAWHPATATAIARGPQAVRLNGTSPCSCAAPRTSHPAPRSPRPGRSRRASMLMEVLVTVTIMALFMALIGAQILSSVQAAGVIERRQTAMLLAESITSRLQAGGFELTDQAQQLADTFGDVYPGWGWRASTEPTDDPTLMRVHLEVLRGDPTQPDAPVDSMATVTDMYTLWALPSKMNLIDDFGLSESDAAGLAELGIDPDNFDPAMLAGLNIADLLQKYPQLEALLAMYGIDPSMLETLDPETIKKAMEAYLATGGTIPNMPGGGTGGGNTETGGTGGNNNGDNDNKGNTGGSFDMSEVTRLLGSGDKEGAKAYIEAHRDELNNRGGGGISGGGI